MVEVRKVQKFIGHKAVQVIICILISRMTQGISKLRKWDFI